MVQKMPLALRAQERLRIFENRDLRRKITTERIS
jgi:hypothetical protein